MIKIFITTILMLCMVCASATETCSRIAIINYQEVLIDTNTTQKGEGLRYHLEKDAEALKYLNIYQEGTKTRLANIILGTSGSLMLITGALTDTDSTQKYLLGTGLLTLIVNFTLAKILNNKNEQNLMRAIDEYNKRNLPRIHYGPGLRHQRSPSGISLNFTRSF